jgi:hypothetical protein
VAAAGIALLGLAANAQHSSTAVRPLSTVAVSDTIPVDTTKMPMPDTTKQPTPVPDTTTPAPDTTKR